MELWRKSWRYGFAPLFARGALESLAAALRTDDRRLIQGATSSPPPLACTQDWPVEAACGVAWCGWQGGQESTTVGDVEEFFARACFDADRNLGEPAECRHFLAWFDDTPRDVVRRELLGEVERALRKLDRLENPLLESAAVSA